MHMAQIEAAKESKRVVVDLTMTIEEARKVIWTGRGPREPMGDLFDSHQIDTGDLAWAIDKAYNPQVRTAAQALLANWLGKPATIEATRRYGPEVVEGSHYLEKNELESLKTGSLLRGYAYGAAVAMILLAVQQFLATKSLATLIVGLLLAFLMIGVWMRSQVKSEFARYENLRQGRKGEEAVVGEFRAVLDNRWIIFRNLHLPDRKDDIDIVLVGPGGVWAIEVKAFGGTVRAQGDTWASLRKGKWVQLRDSPSVQAKRNAVRTRDFLQRSGVNIRWVEAIVTLAEPQLVENFVASENLAYWFLPTLESQAANLVARTPPTDDEIKRITGLFRELATKQVAIEEAKYKKS
jgi:hypothetical protein